MKSATKIEISKKDLEFIYGEDFILFEQKIIPYCYCANCKTSYQSTIINYKIFLNDLNDIILEGFCKSCNHPIARYLETGEVEKYQKIIEKVKRKILKIN
ncbi:hypothetical protein HY945_02075 [Candidatus Gottesmanbacteria bacterium]|nr:hypothetical protein [Candidatus Gottesmanbacteria bacterium]